MRYPLLPASLIVHVGAGGGVQRAAKSIPAAFTVVVQVVVTSLIIASCFFLLRSRPDLDPADPRGSARRDDDRYWRGGLFYVNHDDPAVVVPKRTGLGWTLNMANRWVQLLLTLVVVGVLASLVVPVLSGH